MHVARVLAITEVRNVPPDIRPFVDFKAAVEDRTLSEDERVAIIVIDTTTSYFPVFLSGPITMQRLEADLEKQDAKLASDARELLSRHLSR